MQAEEVIDWEEVTLLYERLEGVVTSPVVALNRAVSIAEAERRFLLKRLSSLSES